LIDREALQPRRQSDQASLIQRDSWPDHTAIPLPLGGSKTGPEHRPWHKGHDLTSESRHATISPIHPPTASPGPSWNLTIACGGADSKERSAPRPAARPTGSGIRSEGFGQQLRDVHDLESEIHGLDRVLEYCSQWGQATARMSAPVAAARWGLSPRAVQSGAGAPGSAGRRAGRPSSASRRRAESYHRL
jgi:hypothetical protein